MNSIINVLQFAKPEGGGFLVDIIYWLVTITSSVAIGIVLFTLILKLITLPFDYISRASMRKNNLIMEQMRPELEKLQEQYADRKDLYNQKMMALYKKNGYSMFGACLPTILTLVIFIIAINAFTNYSKFQNQEYFYNMTIAYNEVVYDGLDLNEEYAYENEDGKFIIDLDAIKGLTDEQKTEKGIILTVSENVNTQGDSLYTVKSTTGYIIFERYYNPTTQVWGAQKFYLDSGVEDNEIFKALTIKVVSENGVEEVKTYAELKTAEYTPDKFLTEVRQEKSAEEYRSVSKRFLWVKNVWVKDSPNVSSIESDWESFKSTHGYEDESGTFTAEDYNSLIFKLDKEKEEPNGYFIMVLITIATSLLTQIVTNKSQKAQMELQTVNGQGKSTSKVMMWMMPIMMAIFAFIYTAAFSIYIILSSVTSLLTTILINKIVDKKFKKKYAAANAKKQVVRGRIYTPPKKEEPAKNTKKDKKEPPKNDFLSGLADKKRKK